MAYRIQSLSTMTVAQVDAIFLRGRGLDLHADHDWKWPYPDTYVASAMVIDDDLEVVR